MKKKLSLFTLIGLGLGIILGLLIPNVMKSLSFIGTIYINLLKFMIIPIVFTAIMATSYKSTKQKEKIVFKTIGLFILMFSLTFLLTSLLVYLIKPGTIFTFEPIDWSGEVANLTIGDIITNLFPTNLVTMIQNNAIFPTFLVAIICGIAATKIPNGKLIMDYNEALKALFNKVLSYIMYLTPFGVCSLIATAIGNYGTSLITVGAIYILIAYLGGLLTMILIMILPVWIIAKINPLTYLKKLYKVWIMTVTTCSSAATLPFTIKTCNEELKIPEKITDVVVPLGCTIHMCGGAVSFALLGLFCCQLYGIPVTFSLYLYMLVCANLINMAAPGIPNGGVVIGATYLSLLNIPLTFIGFYSGIYKILDMNYTTLNVTGDITAAVIINHFNKHKKSH